MIWEAREQHAQPPAMGSVASPVKTDDIAAANSSQPIEGASTVPAAKRQRTSGGGSGSGGGEGARDGGSGGGEGARDGCCAANGAGAHHDGGDRPHGQRREHGHHGHLRTHHAIDEPDAGGGGSGSPLAGRTNADADADTDASPPGSSSKQQQHKQRARLSFEDDPEEAADDGVAAAAAAAAAGPDGGLRAATAERFRREKAALRQRRGGSAHAFHHVRSGGGERSPRGGIAVVDDDSDGGGGGAAAAGGFRHGAAAGAAAARVHFGAASARGLRPYMEDRHCVVASMQLLSSAPDGGAAAGPPLPHDGVPRSYAAVFDGAPRARPSRRWRPSRRRCNAIACGHVLRICDPLLALS